ncbi:MAG: glycosyltransferase family 4 protein [Chitinophagaceae bacterium]|nr:glycosyltransferase family 4 protein [Chitinophagaceae bacterium]
MHLLFTSYAAAPEFSNPDEWLKRIEGYTGILESLAANHRVTSIERINYAGEKKQQGVHYFFVKQFQRTVLFPFRIHRLIRKLKPDVVFINGFVFPLQLIQLRIVLGKRSRIIVINQAEKPTGNRRKILQRWCDRFIEGYLFPSKTAGLEWVEKGIISGENKIYEAFHGSSVFRPADKQQARDRLTVSGSPVFLWVGRLDTNKDPLTVLRAFSGYLTIRPEARLYMIYHSEELLAEIQKFLLEKEMEVSVIMVGKVPHGELQDWFNAADYFISASHYEGGGISATEAMSCGCIPILSDIPPFRVLTGNGVCGYQFKTGDEVSLLSVMRKAGEQDFPEERDKVLRQFNEHFSFDAIAKKIEAAIIRQDQQVQ